MACCKYCACCRKRKPCLCCNCNCCICCCTCNCPPPEIPCLPCLPQMPCLQQMPCLPPPPPPYQVIKERVLVPCPYPVPIYPQISQCSEPRNDCCPDVDYWNPPCQCRWPFPKYIHCPGEPVVPGYTGHIPGLKYHGAARTFGDATRDTKCIMSQWFQNCRRLPWRVFER